jgi:long-chain acyl-CoA synthetase
MLTDEILRVANENRDRDAIVWCGERFTYGSILDGHRHWAERLGAATVAPGTIVALEADFSPEAIGALLALIDRACIVVPLSSAMNQQTDDYLRIAEVETIIDLRASVPSIQHTGTTARHPMLKRLEAISHPGLILFSSGSTGKSKAALHDFMPLLGKFAVRRAAMRMLAFLLFDHVGGLNTLFHVLSNGGCLVTAEQRSPDAICATIEKWRVEVLPATPTFLHLLILSEAYKRHDLSSLRLITYGTEVMPETTLLRLREVLPDVGLQQTYGLSELGILRSKSKSSESLWVKLGGEGFETRVRDGLLEIHAQSAMLGYLNAPSPFTDDGWFKTGDAIEADGEYFRILGRRSEVINIGGEKVFPAEIENVLQMMPGVEEAAIAGEPSAITGSLVVARVKLATNEDLPAFRMRMREYCRGRLAPFKIPQKVILVDRPMHGERFKKLRNEPA